MRHETIEFSARIDGRNGWNYRDGTYSQEWACATALKEISEGIALEILKRGLYSLTVLGDPRSLIINPLTKVIVKVTLVVPEQQHAGPPRERTEDVEAVLVEPKALGEGPGVAEDEQRQPPDSRT